ncbi:aldehyde dehydrogenase (NADP(+)) [Marinovum algicola]|uniref:aldehyde dehydrogenase (NADP(+)) n=1 Tax=Marinovum algicola TaxID=42444 RepID=UPI00352B943E
MSVGKHLIAGNWIGGERTFRSDPAHGEPREFSVGTPDLVDAAVEAAEAAFASYGKTSRADRAAFLNEIAKEIESRVEKIAKIGSQETGLPEQRLIAECGRTTGQLRLFADHITAGDYLDRRHDAALPDRAPLPRPDLKLIQRPIGPVAVFGASNFPLAFSVAGGDTASALAAGCPVVVKGHSGHPGTSEIVAQAIDVARKTRGIDAGVFSLVQGGSRDVGTALVQHPLIAAVGFTGSLAGGRALFDLCAQRPTPIPFFGELGSVNPMFVLPAALSARAASIGEGWAGSLTMGVGQFCTQPGIAIVVAGPEADTFVAAAATALDGIAPQTMLTEGIAQAYHSGAAKFDSDATTTRHTGHDGAVGDGRTARPVLLSVPAKDWLENASLHHEVFGPLGLVVLADDVRQMHKIAASLDGQLTLTLQMENDDREEAGRLIPTLERKAGRILANAFPTGVEVSDTMVHGGPYPASTNFGATSVGTLAIRRFVRPVCYQNLPDSLVDDFAGNP